MPWRRLHETLKQHVKVLVGCHTIIAGGQQSVALLTPPMRLYYSRDVLLPVLARPRARLAPCDARLHHLHAACGRGTRAAIRERS